MLIRYDLRQIEIALTEGALEMRYPGGVMPIGYADVRAIRFVARPLPDRGAE